VDLLIELGGVAAAWKSGAPVAKAAQGFQSLVPHRISQELATHMPARSTREPMFLIR